ncbi:MAG: two-component sensor histidine kinase, partial [Caulobacteraceae bacterium]
MKFPRLLEPIHMQRLIKRSLPTSLFGRSLLIIVLPVALMQIAVTWIFFDAHWQTVTGRLSDGLAGEVAWAVESYEDEPNSSTMAKLADRAEKSLSLSIALQPGKELPARRRTNTFAVVDRSLERARQAMHDGRAEAQ